jgi:hypothetical protein
MGKKQSNEPTDECVDKWKKNTILFENQYVTGYTLNSGPINLHCCQYGGKWYAFTTLHRNAKMPDYNHLQEGNVVCLSSFRTQFETPFDTLERAKEAAMFLISTFPYEVIFDE